MSQVKRPFLDSPGFESPSIETMSKEEVRSHFEDIGVVPALRTCSTEDAIFVAETLAQGGIPIFEIAMNVPGAFEMLGAVVKKLPRVIVGGGSIVNVEMAKECLNAGARFLTSEGLVLPVVEFAARQNVVICPGAFTPTEIIAAWSAGSDFVKVVPCDAAGGHSYIRSLKAALPEVPLIAAGGVTQLTAFDIMSAGATALGVSTDMIPTEAIRLRQSARIQELARRFLGFVDNGRIQAAGQNYILA